MKLSARAYSISREISLVGVVKAINSGRLAKSVTKLPNGRYQIDPDLADQEWQMNTDSGKHGKTRSFNAPPPALPTADEPGETLTYAEARAQHERFKSRLAELEVATIEGKLVNADEVKRESFRAARQVRDSLLNLPDRLAAELAAETNQFKVHQRLVKEIRRALEDLKFE